MNKSFDEKIKNILIRAEKINNPEGNPNSFVTLGINLLGENGSGGFQLCLEKWLSTSQYDDEFSHKGLLGGEDGLREGKNFAEALKELDEMVTGLKPRRSFSKFIEEMPLVLNLVK